jgi:transposase
MTVFAGFDVHRAQITFDALDTETDEITRGRIDSTRPAVERWVGRFPGREVHVAVEACTGWLFVCQALERTGAVAHLAEPVETSALRGRRRRAKTDREDARWLRELLTEGRLPESWVPPEHVRQWRTRARLRKTLVDERTAWHQRIRATLYHHGISGSPEHLSTLAGREFLAKQALPIDATERITIALEMIDLLEIQIARIESEIRKLARRQTGCKALMTLYGMGELTALITLTELGDVSRMHASRQAASVRRDRYRGAPLRPHRTRREAHPPRIRRTALGALRSGPIRVPAIQSRPSGLPGTQSPRTVTHPCVADDRAQARAPLLPRPA